MTTFSFVGLGLAFARAAASFFCLSSSFSFSRAANNAFMSLPVETLVTDEGVHGTLDAVPFPTLIVAFNGFGAMSSSTVCRSELNHGGSSSIAPTPCDSTGSTPPSTFSFAVT